VQSRRRPTRRAFALAGGASAVAAGAVGVFFMVPRDERFATTLGEVRRVKLPDGSTATINTDSDVVVSMNAKVRKLTLAKGEAWFKVMKDTGRPFVVEAGDFRVRAVGTAFSVRRRDEGADVVVSEGVVEAWTVGREASRTRVGAGNRVFLSDKEASAVAPVAGSIEDALAWRNGQIDLHGETLAEAAAEFNRYNARKIVIADQGLASEKVVGRFSTDEPETFVRAVAGAVGARVAADDGSLRLYRAGTR
jgi:transmembrane sensor